MQEQGSLYATSQITEILNKISKCIKLFGIDETNKILDSITPINNKQQDVIKFIITNVCFVYGISLNELLNGTSKGERVVCANVCFHIIHLYTNVKPTKISDILGKDKTAFYKAQKWVECLDRTIKQDLVHIENIELIKQKVTKYLNNNE